MCKEGIWDSDTFVLGIQNPSIIYWIILISRILCIYENKAYRKAVKSYYTRINIFVFIHIRIYNYCNLRFFYFSLVSLIFPNQFRSFLFFLLHLSLKTVFVKSVRKKYFFFLLQNEKKNQYLFAAWGNHVFSYY